MLACDRRTCVKSMVVPGSSGTRLAGWRSDIGSVSICSCVMTCATSVRVTSMTGATPDTVTVSCRFWTSIFTSCRNCDPSVSVSRSTATVAKPASSAFSS